jgi:hypothetical protein
VVTDAMVYAFHGAICDGAIGAEEFEDLRKGIRAALAAQSPPLNEGGSEPVGYVNSDELDNMLDDRQATLSPKQTGWHRKPLYACPQSVAINEGGGEAVAWYRDEQVDAHEDSQGLPPLYFTHRNVHAYPKRPNGEGWKPLYAAPQERINEGGKGEVVVPSFDCTLAAAGAYDPQSFIDGAKWAQDRLAAPQPSAAALTDTEILAAWDRTWEAATRPWSTRAVVCATVRALLADQSRDEVEMVAEQPSALSDKGGA